MRSIYLVVFFIFCHAVEVYSQQSKKTPRKDGFYFYDNGIDSFKTIPDSKDLWLLYREMLDKNGFKLDPKSEHCLPDSIGILREGSTMLHYVSFFTDSTGTAFEDACRNPEVIRKRIKLIQSRKSGVNTDPFFVIENINNVKYANDGNFIFNVSNESYFGEKFTALLRNDSLFVNQSRTGFLTTQFAYSKRNYVFIPFNKIPDNIGQTQTVK